MAALVEEGLTVLVLAAKSKVPGVVRLVRLEVVSCPSRRRLLAGNNVTSNAGCGNECDGSRGDELEHCD